MTPRLTNGLKDACTLSLSPGGLFLFHPCIRPSLSTQVHLTSPQFASCPVESTKMNPCSAAPNQLWQQLMGFALPVARCLPAPPCPPSNTFLWEGTISCQCVQEHGHKKGTQQGTAGLGTEAAALRVVDSESVTTTVSPQRCHHNGVTTTAKTQRGGEVEKGFKCKRGEEQCSPRTPCSSKPKAILMRNAFPRQSQQVCLREVHILSPTKFHGAFHGT